MPGRQAYSLLLVLLDIHAVLSSLSSGSSSSRSCSRRHLCTASVHAAARRLVASPCPPACISERFPGYSIYVFHAETASCNLPSFPAGHSRPYLYMQLARFQHRVVGDPGSARATFRAAVSDIPGNRELWLAFLEFEAAQPQVQTANEITVNGKTVTNSPSQYEGVAVPLPFRPVPSLNQRWQGLVGLSMHGASTPRDTFFSVLGLESRS